MARVLLAIPCDHYFDDYYIVDIAVALMSGQEGLDMLHVIVGIDLEPDKRKHMDRCHVALGVSVDVGLADTHGAVIARATVDRVVKILGMLRKAKLNNHLNAGQASVVRGKLGFILEASFSRIGRAATQPLVDREYHDDTTSFNRSLDHMLEFFEILLPSLPPLQLPVSAAFVCGTMY